MEETDVGLAGKNSCFTNHETPDGLMLDNCPISEPLCSVSKLAPSLLIVRLYQGCQTYGMQAKAGLSVGPVQPTR